MRNVRMLKEVFGVRFIDDGVRLRCAVVRVFEVKVRWQHLLMQRRFVDALTRSSSNLHPRHILHPSNTLPKFLKCNTSLFKLRPNLLYRLLLPTMISESASASVFRETESTHESSLVGRVHDMVEDQILR